MNSSLTHTILMIRPAHFVYNAQTAVNNTFQQKSDNNEAVQKKALAEFDYFVSVLRTNKVTVLVVDDTDEPHTPDSIFPNNWVSFHEGSIVLYPMFAVNRRWERNKNVLHKINYAITDLIDFTNFENENLYLEGTGSIVLDRKNKIAYACLSERTHKDLFLHFCHEMAFTPISFTAVDSNGKEIYHTNVMMCVGENFGVVCLDAIKSNIEKKLIKQAFDSTQKEMIEISLDQMNHFAGNMLQIKNTDDEKLIVMSLQAFNSLSENQKLQLKKHGTLVHASLETIETNGGGSARCMMAEVF